MNKLEPRVAGAFGILLEELQALRSELSTDGQQAFASGDHASAAELADKLGQASELQVMLEKARDKWVCLAEGIRPKKWHPSLRPRSRLQSLRGGLKTPETAYRTPILETLVELGGRATTDQIRPRLLAKLEGVLGPHDLEGLPSNPTCPRWWNTAMWCRLYMVKEGLLRGDSPRGVWEISDRGRRALERTTSHEVTSPV